MDNNSISFYVNGKTYTVNNVGPTDVLNSWLRLQPGLTGTKSMCFEGGCGSCVVALQRPAEKIIAVNSVSESCGCIIIYSFIFLIAILTCWLLSLLHRVIIVSRQCDLIKKFIVYWLSSEHSKFT